jgi:serine/threonine protein phosphatase 1
MNKILAIGEIHGCLDKRQKFINKIPISKKGDTLVFIGDYIDRGSSYKEVIDKVIKLCSKFAYAICLYGNHKQMFLNYLSAIDEVMYVSNGRNMTLLSYGISPAAPP